MLSSREDHTVAPENGDEIVEKSSGPVERIWLEESYHVATLDNDQAARRERDARVPREGLGVMATLRREDVAHVAKLARLTMSEGELDKFTEQLGQVLEHASDMNALDLDGVVPTAHPFGLDQRRARRRTCGRVSTTTR